MSGSHLPGLQRGKLRPGQVAGGRERADPRSLGLFHLFPHCVAHAGREQPQVPKANQASWPRHEGERKKRGRSAHKLSTRGLCAQEHGQGHPARPPLAQPGASLGWGGDRGFRQWQPKGLLHPFSSEAGGSPFCLELKCVFRKASGSYTVLPFKAHPPGNCSVGPRSIWVPKGGSETALSPRSSSSHGSHR